MEQNHEEGDITPRLPVQFEVPPEYTRLNHQNHTGLKVPIGDTVQFSYGTAGFRTRDEFMGFIVYRVATWTALRARNGEHGDLGIMITASHNPVGDNGVKIVEDRGRMLKAEDQLEIQRVVNLPEGEFVDFVVDELQKTPTAPPHSVHLGWDTRPSSSYLSLAALKAASNINCRIVALGQVTTPQLHYAVTVHNYPEYGPSQSFTKRFVDGVNMFMQYFNYGADSPARMMVAIDCANGVGGLWIGQYLRELRVPLVTAAINNVATGTEKLNKNCGADFVKIHCKPPTGFENTPPNCRCASLDGDADRLVYFYQDLAEHMHILDGDHISALFAIFLKEHIDAVPEIKEQMFTFGIVQTAYANGSSTEFFRKLQCEVVFARTGVQNLQIEAETFDIGIYFEANGHGTVFFSNRFLDFVTTLQEENPENAALGRLVAFTQIINHVVGDGIADFLAVETILRYKGWNVFEWQSATYVNLPSIQLKLPVPDRSKFRSSPRNEAVLLEPEGLQERIDEECASYHRTRAFVRPSGTENILRVYAEAPIISDAINLAETIKLMLINEIEIMSD